jgi:predicted small lipoprotein YifL
MLLVLVAAALAGTACGRKPGAYSPPAQRVAEPGRDPEHIRSFVSMDDPQAADYIVKDIASDPGLFRWAFLEPELKLGVGTNRGLKFAMEFALPDATFKTTGPVTVSCSINGHKLGEMRCPRADKYRLEKAVPADWVDPARPVHVTFNAEPRWVSPDDGAQLSFLLYSAGFIQ